MTEESTNETKLLKDVRMETTSARMVSELLMKNRIQQVDSAGIFGKVSQHEMFSSLFLNADVTRWPVGDLKPLTAKDFQYVHDLAIKQLEIAILHKMELLYRSCVCKNERHLEKPLPLKVFSWSAREFEKRNKVKNNAWVDVLMKDISSVCLEMRKMKVDLEECVRFITTLLSSKKTGTIMENETFMDALKLLAIESTVEDELAENTTKLQRIINSWLLNSISRDKEKANKTLLMQLEKQLMEAHVSDPINIRYEINYYQMGSAQAELMAEKQCQEYTDEIEKLQKAMQRESYTSQCTLNSYYSDTGKYRHRLEELTNKYNRTYDEYENRNQYMHNSMESIRNQRKFLTEQIERFREERERILIEQEREMQRRLEERVVVADTDVSSPRRKKGKKGNKGKK